MVHDIPTIAFHEAGHAVLVAASPLREKLAYVQITPDDPKEGGRTVLKNHIGKCPENEKALEIAKNLAGPLAQIFFCDATIKPEFRERFHRSLLAEVTSVDTLNQANVPAWYGDVKAFLGILKHANIPKFVNEFHIIERNLRLWIQRKNVRKCIESVACALKRQMNLGSKDVLGLCRELQPDDHVTNDSLLGSAEQKWEK